MRLACRRDASVLKLRASGPEGRNNRQCVGPSGMEPNIFLTLVAHRRVDLIVFEWENLKLARWSRVELLQNRHEGRRAVRHIRADGDACTSVWLDDSVDRLMSLMRSNAGPEVTNPT